MGCGGSSDAGGAPKGVNKNEYAQLLEHYTLGKVLGQGAFGVVYLCKKKSDGKEYAVKMIDKVESPLEDIRRECDLLKELKHPAIVELIDVFYEKVFVCMVLALYPGGDLIEGMQLHWKTVGVIPCSAMPNIAKQMLSGVAHLHMKNCVHRDVKGDNYLMDRKQITDNGCKIYLSDFGTVCKVDPAPEKRLHSSCGTQVYWSPEFYQGDYKEKVDIWAIGVVMYGLVEGKFPFKNEPDTRTKVVRLPSRCPEKLVKFIHGLLEKKEADRLSAKAASDHDWFGEKKPEAAEEATKMDMSEIEVRENGPNAGIAQRRAELIERIQDANDKGTGNALSHFHQGTFAVNPDKRAEQKKTITYEWQPNPKCFEELGKAQNVQDKGDEAQIGATIDTLSKQLQAHNIDTKKFGTGSYKTLKDLAGEVYTGSSQLMLDAEQHKNLVRVVDLVLLRITDSQKRYIIQIEEVLADGRPSPLAQQLPGAKKEPHENSVAVAERILVERLDMKVADVTLSFLPGTEVWEEMEESKGFPGNREGKGMTTVYRKEIVEGKIADAKAMKPETKDPRGILRKWAWKTQAECDAAKVKLSPLKGKNDVSALVLPPIGFEENELMEYLKECKVDISKFGKEGYRTLRDFSTELIKGESTLVKSADGKVQRVVEVVILDLRKGADGNDANMILVQKSQLVDGKPKELNRMPAVKRRPDENQFLAAQRVLKRELQMEANYVRIDPSTVRILEEPGDSTNYPGLTTLYKKRIIRASLGPASS